MGKVQYENWEVEHFKETEEGRKYLEYNEKVGGEPISLIIPFGHPKGVEEMGGVLVVYDECIKRGITWKEFLEFNPPDDAIL